MSDPKAEGAVETQAGRVALFGWTNVGKSDAAQPPGGTKASPPWPTWRRRRGSAILGVCHLERRGQIALIDTPGLHQPKHEMNRRMVALARHSLEGADVVALVIDAGRGLGPGDREAARDRCAARASRAWSC